MKIIQVIDQLNVGGAERVLVDISNLLHEHGHDVTVLCLLDESVLDTQLNKQIPIIYLRRKNKFNPIYIIRLYKVLKQFNVIHIHLRQVLRYVSLLFYVTQIGKKKVVLFHDHYGKINEDKSISESLRKAIKKCTGYIGVSEQLKDWAVSNDLNPNVLKLSNIVRTSLKNEKINLSLNTVNIVSVGNFRPQKNYEFLIELIKVLPHSYRFTIYGQIVDTDYYNKVIALIDNNNIADRVSVVTNCNSVHSKLLQYHLAIHCADSETGPLVAIEYMSKNLPFITYNTGEVAKQVKTVFPEFIQNDFIVNSWIDSINDIVLKRDIYVNQLSKFYEENYSEENYLKQCLSIYESLLNSKNKMS
ncbi:glycosyltransferase [Winogradskyella sp.]|uniref:glycosyltransferase n=1 Tax=Winogradskyella sp. TaxID=1883156 RepID=UPI003F6B3348